ncbi:MAG: cation transporter [Candidatus Liptonbacteria bacterium]|nr:cation transporter [Candidatus Liptonbacteria bacterium]
MDARQRLGIKHTPACDVRGRCFCETTRYVLILLVSLGVFGGEFVGARIAGSLSLLADSFHTLMDGITVVPSIGVALYAVYSAKRDKEKKLRRFVALISSILLAGVSYYIVQEAWERYLNPRTVDPFAVVIIAGMALIGNGIAFWILGSYAEDDAHATTHRGMAYHVLSDIVESSGVCVGGVFMYYTGLVETDIILSALIAVLIFRLAVILFVQSVRRAT